MRKVTRTFLRTKDTMTKYIEMANTRGPESKVNPFLDWKSSLIKEFTHWVIISNTFPYDAVATVSHMIATKREVPFDWKLLTNEEKNELDVLKGSYLSTTYDVVWENLPKGQTMPGHFHLHLLVLKREEV